MSKKIIIDKFGLGNAIVVMEKKKILDFFLDPPLNAPFYPVNTFLKAKVLRKISQRGGYFVRLPNGKEGFLRSRNDYKEGKIVNICSKAFFEREKPQLFSDKLKTISKHFVLDIGGEGISFSKKLPENWDRKQVFDLIVRKTQNVKNIHVICRSSILKLSLNEIEDSLDKVFDHTKSIFNSLESDGFYNNGSAKKLVSESYDSAKFVVIEEEGIFEKLDIWPLIHRILSEKVYFGDGSYLFLEQTKSFCLVDINSGVNLKISVEKLNLDACHEIFNTFRLQGIGGKILIDFLPCSKVIKEKIEAKMNHLFINDKIKTKIWGWTKGGSFEMERKRDKIPLRFFLLDN